MTAYSSVSPDVEIDLGVEVRQHDHGNEAEDEALAPVDVGGVGRVQAEGGHVKEHAGHVHAVHLSNDEREGTKNYLRIFADICSTWQYHSILWYTIVFARSIAVLGVSLTLFKK